MANIQSVYPLPAFADIDVAIIEAQLDSLLSNNRQRITELLAKFNAGQSEQSTADLQQLLAQLEEWDDELERFWSPISHLHGVKNSDELRAAYNACLPKLTEYATEMGQNKALFELFRSVATSEGFAKLDCARRKAVDNALRDFTLSGIDLESTDQQRFADIKRRLAELSTQFSNHVLDATQGWSKHLETPAQLAGIPESSIEAYRLAAEAKGEAGYLITLDIPAYLPLMQYCDDGALREELYVAYTTRASEQGPGAGRWDNSVLMTEILSLRHELAALLGFESFSDYSLATKMAQSPQQVEDFLNDLAEQSLPVAKRDYAELVAFAAACGKEDLSAWDIPYYSEKLRLEKYALSQQQLRPYFPAQKVIAGMFTIVGKLFGITVAPLQGVDCWHSDVQFFQVLRNDEVIAQFYLDIYARDNKRGGAWMADCRVRRKTLAGKLQLPVAFLTCNFTPPTDQLPSLLTHNEVTTLFHEFGHGLHHMLTEIDCAQVSGINGVAWDAVELPSQFLENWCWQKPAIELISGHHISGEPLPDELLEKMLAAKNFQSGMMMMRQLEFALFDWRLHNQAPAKNSAAIQGLLDNIRDQLAVYAVPSENRFQHGFSHIFSGGYAAGYYSYKWAELLSADAFSLFEEKGIFDQAAGTRFLQEILQRGGASEPMELFVNFRGRPPTVAALLRHSGIVSDAAASVQELAS